MVRQTIVEHDVEHVPRGFRKPGDFVGEIGPIGNRRHGRLAICATGLGGGRGWGRGVHNWIDGFECDVRNFMSFDWFVNLVTASGSHFVVSH